MTTSVTPWWKALKIRQEILSASGQIDDVQMSLFAAVHGAGAARPPYADARYYGEITHPTARLVDLLTEIAIRVGAGDDYRALVVVVLDGGNDGHNCLVPTDAAYRERDGSWLVSCGAGICSVFSSRSSCGTPLAGPEKWCASSWVESSWLDRLSTSRSLSGSMRCGATIPGSVGGSKE